MYKYYNIYISIFKSQSILMLISYISHTVTKYLREATQGLKCSF